MKILVTGASGFLGSHLSRALVGQGHLVRALVRSSSPRVGLEGLSLQFAVGDLFDPPSLRAATEGIDVVFHCAGQVARWRRADHMIESHVQGTRNVIAAAQSSRVQRLIYTSSVASLGLPDRDRNPDGSFPKMDETHAWNTTRSVWPYGFAKHLAEQEVYRALDDGLAAVILNPSAVFGSGDVHRYHVGLVGRMLAGRLPPVAPPGGLNAIHIDDVVAGHLAALERGTPGFRYILGGENMTHVELLTQAARALGRTGPRLRIPGPPLRMLGRAAQAFCRWLPLPTWLGLFAMAGLHFYYDGTLAHDELGFEPQHTVSEAITQAAAWFRAHGEDLE
ncbi:MAG: NAD-dependent epimerase/dehydratase family protein [Anaerolineales bacterium]